MIPLGAKLTPPRGVTSWNNSNEEGRIHFCGENDSGKRSRAIMALLLVLLSVDDNDDDDDDDDDGCVCGGKTTGVIKTQCNRWNSNLRHSKPILYRLN